jgi:Flp pilus assembly protein CpaB
MQNRTPIIVALLVAVVAIFLTNMYIEQIRQESEPATTAVMVASRDLPAGTVLGKEDLSYALRYTQAVPKFHVPFNENTLYLGQELTTAVTTTSCRRTSAAARPAIASCRKRSTPS